MAPAPRDLIDRDLKQVVETVGRRQLIAEALMIGPMVSQSIRTSRQTAVRAVVVIRRQTRSSKSRVNGAPSRGNGTPSTCTPCSGQRNRRKTTQPPPDRDGGDRADPDPGQVHQAGECSSDSHGRRPPVRWTSRTREPTGPSQCASPRSPPSRSSGPGLRRHPCRRATPSRSHLAPSQRGERNRSTVGRDSQSRSLQCNAPAQAPKPAPDSPTIIRGAASWLGLGGNNPSRFS